MALFIDVKEAFNHMLKTKLVKKILKLGIDSDLICWTRSFLTDQNV